MNDPDLDAFDTANRAKLRARELIFCKTLLSGLFPSRPEYLATTMLHENLNAVCHLTSTEQSDSDESPEDLR